MSNNIDCEPLGGIEASESSKMARAAFSSRSHEFSKNFMQFRENAQWLAHNRDALRTAYPNMYIAVRRKKVILHDKDFKMLLSKVKREYNNAPDIVLDYIGKQKLKLLL